AEVRRREVRTWFGAGARRWAELRPVLAESIEIAVTVYRLVAEVLPPGWCSTTRRTSCGRSSRTPTRPTGCSRTRRCDLIARLCRAITHVSGQPAWVLDDNDVVWDASNVDPER